jgi:hypothetical protein
MNKLEQEKVAKVMGEYKRGTLHSGRVAKGGKKRVVKNRKQAVAIALSEAKKYALEKMARGK